MSKKSPESSEKIPPQPLSISLCQQTGSLLTSPLSSILSLSLSSLYQDLYDMTNDEISVVVKKQAADKEMEEEEDAATDAALTLSTEKMSSLPFSQRRFELCSRIAKHSQSIKHTCALLSYDWTSNVVQDCSAAFEHVHSNWIQADEAQDALYFAHSKLFFGRKWCYDVQGALKLLCGGGVWDDFPVDVELSVNPYETSEERGRGVEEVRARLQCAVRRKLIGNKGKCWSRVVLEKGGGVVKLLFWEENDKSMIEARVTVLSEQDDAEWTLLSINVNVNPKTGESHHQLQTNNRQKFDLHRLCVRSMVVEEARIRKKQRENKEEDIVAKPLDCLFEVAHTFAISQQLEILAAQADALKRGGIWLDLQTSPIQYITEDEELQGVALAAIHFWDCDDRFGMPLISDLQDSSIDTSFSKYWKPNTSSSYSSTQNNTNFSQKFTLLIRSIPKQGMRISLSGASSILQKINNPENPDQFLKRNVDKILHSIQNPFHLSMSDALLSSTLACAQMRCLAVVNAIQSCTLPNWIRMDVDCATICIAVRIQYSKEHRPFVTLFRFGIDSRTGKFISIFSPSCSLLRSLVCNDPTVSTLHQIRISQTNTTKKRVVDKLLHQLTGRIIRDHFDGLHRSLDILGKRVGLGNGAWKEHDDTSEKLREKVVLGCVQDAFKSLFVCCGISAIFGLVNHSLRIVFGVDCCVDMAGNVLDSDFLPNIIPVPPLSIVLNQSIQGDDKSEKTGDKKEKNVVVCRQVLGVVASVEKETGILIHFLQMETSLDSLVSVPTRIQSTRIDLKEEHDEPPRKKCRSSNDGVTSFNEEIEYLSNLLLSSKVIQSFC